MKLIQKPIDVIVNFSAGKLPEPIKFRYLGQVVKVDQVISAEKTVYHGYDAMLYSCQSKIKNEIRRYDLIYYTKSCQWELCRI